MEEKIIIIIPAYKPNLQLIKLVNNLYQRKLNKIIVINDGSGKEYNDIFMKIEDKVQIINNDINKGKGISLKLGMSTAKKQYENIIGCVLVDADGQHQIKDIENVVIALEENNKIVFGARNFNKIKGPLKSKIGNAISNKMILKKYNVKMKDSQTGLRAIPSKYLNEIIKLSGERFEYEYNMIKYILENKIPYMEVDIATIYDKENKTNFKAIKDGIKILRKF